MNDDVEYTVEWLVDGLTADSPMEAAREALRMQRNRDSIATVFKVSWVDQADGMIKTEYIDVTGDVGACPSDILTTPSPHEHLLPPAVEIQRWGPEHASGCLIEGSWGTYGKQRLVEFARSCGWDPGSTSDARICENTPHGSPEDEEFMAEIADEIETWLNDHVAADRHLFGWHGGEFMYWSWEEWCDTPENCPNLDHKHQ